MAASVNPQSVAVLATGQSSANSGKSPAFATNGDEKSTFSRVLDEQQGAGASSPASPDEANTANRRDGNALPGRRTDAADTQQSDTSADAGELAVEADATGLALLAGGPAENTTRGSIAIPPGGNSPTGVLPAAPGSTSDAKGQVPFGDADPTAERSASGSSAIPGKLAEIAAGAAPRAGEPGFGSAPVAAAAQSIRGGDLKDALTAAGLAVNSDAKPSAGESGIAKATVAGAADPGRRGNDLANGDTQVTRNRSDWLAGAQAMEQRAQFAGAERVNPDSIDLPRALAARADAAPVSSIAIAGTPTGGAPTMAVPSVATANTAPATAMPTYALTHAPDDPAFVGEMSARMKTLIRDGVGEARLHLHPAELGRLQVTVTTDGDQTRLIFVTETAAAREAIEQSMPRLREMLEQSGLQLAQADVGQQELPNGRAQADATAPDRAGNDSDTADTANPHDAALAGGTSGRIDTYI